MGKWDWTKRYRTIRKKANEGIVSASYALNDLVEAGLIGKRRAARFRSKTGLADFAWRVFWSKEAFQWRRYGEAMRRARGFVVFMHGWDASHAIWRRVPALVCAADPRQVKPRRWRHFSVVLGHKDRLVGIKPILELLEELGFTSGQVDVVLGDHYLFSVSNQSRHLHLRNREIVAQEILDLYETCRSGMS